MIQSRGLQFSGWIVGKRVQLIPDRDPIYNLQWRDLPEFVRNVGTCVRVNGRARRWCSRKEMV